MNQKSYLFNEKSYLFDENMKMLPYELKLVIWEKYLTPCDKLFINKYYYEKNHNLIFNFYPRINNKKQKYLQMLAKYNCYYIISLITQDHPTLLYTPKMRLRLYFKENIYFSYLTFMKVVALENKSHKTVSIINEIIHCFNSGITENCLQKKNRKEKKREKKNFKTKKYVKEWGN